MAQIVDYEKKLQRILDLDENIRFVAISDMNGNPLATKHKENTELYLSLDESKETLKHAAVAWKSRMKHYDKIGRGLYTLAVYEKLRRVTIPLKSDHLLLVTIDNKGGQKQIIDKILNEVIIGDYTNPIY